MLSDNTIEYIAKVFIGDKEKFYSYKKGSELVDFFNENFGFDDVYTKYFDTRWRYTFEKLKELWEINYFNEFIDLILSKEFVMRDSNINEIEVLDKIEVIINAMNKELNIDGYKILKRQDEYKIDNDENIRK